MKTLLYGNSKNEQKVSSYLNLENCFVCICGGRGTGKLSLLKNIEIDLNQKQFVRISFRRLKEVDKLEIYLKNAISRYKEVVLYLRSDDAEALDDPDIQKSFFSILNIEMEDERRKLHVVVMTDDWKTVMKQTVHSYKVFMRSLNKNERVSMINDLITAVEQTPLAVDSLRDFVTTLYGYQAADVKALVKNCIYDFKYVTLANLQQAKKENPLHKVIFSGTQCRKVHWSDIGGYEDVKKSLIEKVQEPLRVDRPLPRGVLLYGPPGCCKTTLVCALATECQLELVAIKPTDIMSKYLGESETNLRRVISTAESFSPSILFIDEVDTLFPGRSQSESEVSRRLLSTLLTFLDGVTDSEHKVVLVCATNRMDHLDEAFVRPGRMNLRIEVGLPDEMARRAIIDLHLNPSEYEFDDGLHDELVRLTQGESGAGIVEQVVQVKDNLELRALANADTSKQRIRLSDFGDRTIKPKMKEEDELGDDLAHDEVIDTLRDEIRSLRESHESHDLELKILKSMILDMKK